MRADQAHESAMLKGSYTIAKVWGIPIRIHISLILLLPFLITDLGSRITDDGGMQIWAGLLIELGLLVSICLHELGHSILALGMGCRVREILLLPIGGAAQLERMPTRPLHEFLMAIAGPAVSLALAIGFHQGFKAAYDTQPFFALISLYLAIINGALVVFNLLPSFPMDGGRVLRAVLTPKLGRLRATATAAKLGQLMAVTGGLYGFFSRPPSWTLVAIAFFIYISAGNEYRHVQMQELAKRGGGGPFGFGFPPTDDGPEDGDAADDVIVSPPPYERGSGRRVRLRDDERGPFSAN
jgi:stage IV sporulation protein FB